MFILAVRYCNEMAIRDNISKPNLRKSEMLLRSSKDILMIPDLSMITHKRSQYSRIDQTGIFRISISKLCLVKPFLCNFDLLKWIFGFFSKRHGFRAQPSMQRRLMMSMYHSSIVVRSGNWLLFGRPVKSLGNSLNHLENSSKSIEKVENVEFFTKNG